MAGRADQAPEDATHDYCYALSPNACSTAGAKMRFMRNRPISRVVASLLVLAQLMLGPFAHATTFAAGEGDCACPCAHTPALGATRVVLPGSASVAAVAGPLAGPAFDAPLYDFLRPPN